MVKKSESKVIVGKTFRKNKSGGYKKLRTRAADSYAGLSNKEILQVTKNDVKYRQYTVKFTNRAKPKPVRVQNIHDQHQIDLVDMRKMKTQYKGKTYRYIFLLLDIFSRFHWLAPLERKLSSHVLRELNKIYSVNGQPKRLQSDNGGEFKKRVKAYCQRKKIKMIRCRPYNPKAQGKVERSHRVLRQKIDYDLFTQKKNGVNWVKNLPEYMKCLNNEKREALGWKSPFEVYFGRKSNEVLMESFESTEKAIVDESYEPPRASDYQKQNNQNMKVREKVRTVSKRIEQRMIDAHSRKNCYVTFKSGDKVFVRLGKKRGKFGGARHRIVLGTVTKVLPNDMYQVKFSGSGSDPTVSTQKFSVEDMATCDMDRQKDDTRKKHDKSRKAEENKKRRNHKDRFLIPMTAPERFHDQGFTVSFDPLGDGNCQFSAVAFALRRFGITKTARGVRSEVVEYLSYNDAGPEGYPLELYAATPWSNYLGGMSRDGSYGDEITLRAIANIYGITITVVSTLGPHAMVNIYPDTVSRGSINLGHVDEQNGIHYMVLDEAEQNQDESHSEPEEAEKHFEEGRNINLHVPETEKHSEEVERNVAFQVEKRDSKPIFSYFDLLPLEVTEMIFLYALSVSGFEFPNHVCWTYNSLLQSYDLFKLFTAKGKQHLPRVHISHPEVLPKVGKLTNTLTVNAQRLVREFSSASGIVKEIKRIVNHPKWASAWLTLQPEALSLFIILNIVWKTKKLGTRD